MTILLVCLHVMAAVFLVIVVLLQQGKGADIGAAFGAGSSQTLFGSRGAGNFLTKLTTGFVIVFMATSMGLSYLGTERSGLIDVEGARPATPAPADAPQAPAPDATPAPEGATPAPDAAPAPADPSAAPATGEAAPADAAPAPAPAN